MSHLFESEITSKTAKTDPMINSSAYSRQSIKTLKILVDLGTIYLQSPLLGALDIKVRFLQRNKIVHSTQYQRQ